MPQMSPMNWILLMLIVLLNYLILMIFIYYSLNNYLIKNKNFYINMQKMNFLIEWF